MTKTNHYIKEEEYVLKKENSKTKFTVRLHFIKEDESGKTADEIQNILLETYIKNLKSKGDV